MLVGIDLGTSTSEISYINAQGKPEIIPNHINKPVTPSVVYIDEEQNPIVGEEALEKLLIEPENTFIEVKRMLGQKIILTARGKSYTPVDISAYILQYLVNCAEDYLKEKVDRAVITVPAYFTDIQRRETLAAGEQIGLKVERIINEPTSAALCYGVSHMEDYSNILVYDFGGGTLDVTVLELFEGVVEVKSTCGNNRLGGKDFDAALIDYMREKIGVGFEDLRIQMRIREAAQACKIALSSQQEYSVELPFLTEKDGVPIGYTDVITRKKFEELIGGMVESTAEQVERAILDAELGSEDIDLVLLIGGSTRIPLVQSFLKNFVGMPPRFSVDPDLGVAYGAAVQGAIIDGHEDTIILTDVCPYSLSTEVLVNSFFFETTECDILIKRNTMIPAYAEKVYVTAYDYQDAVSIDVYQGESKEPNENIFLDGFTLRGIPSAKKGKEQVKVVFAYDLNGILRVSAEIISNGKKASIEINTAEHEYEEMDVSNWLESKSGKKYRTVIRKAEKVAATLDDEDDKQELEAIIYKLKVGIIKDRNVEELDDIKDSILVFLETV